MTHSTAARCVMRCLSAAILWWSLSAAPALAGLPTIAIIMDDLGNGFTQTAEALRLPGRITYSFLPYGPHSARLAALANRYGKEVMLHLPMQAVADWPLGPGALTLDMTEAAFKARVSSSLRSIPAASGVNNHMGSLLTRHPGHMGWLMEAIRDRNPPLYFVDSKTTDGSVAYRMAREHGVPALRRDLFLDSPDSGTAYVRERLTELIRLAKQNGRALAIAHPYPQTLAVLRKQLPELTKHRVRLVNVSEMLSAQTLARANTR